MEFDLSQTVTDEDSEADENESPETYEESTNDYQLVREMRKRNIKPPTRLGYAYIIEYALNIVEEPDISEPGTYREAISYKQRNKWQQAIQEEMNLLIRW